MNKLTDQEMGDILTRFTKRVDEEMPVTGVYEPIAEYAKIPLLSEYDVACRFALRIYQMPFDIQPDRSISYIEDYVLSTDGYKASMIIQLGHKDALLDFLRADGLVEKLHENLKRLDKMLTDD